MPRPPIAIVGLVKDTKYTDLREPFTPLAFFAGVQDDEPDAVRCKSCCARRRRSRR